MISERDLLDAVDGLTPEALQTLLIYAANQLWEAVDEGRADAASLLHVADHLHMLIRSGPASAQ